MMKELNQSFFEIQKMPLSEIVEFAKILEEQQEDMMHEMEKAKAMPSQGKFAPL